MYDSVRMCIPLKFELNDGVTAVGSKPSNLWLGVIPMSVQFRERVMWRVARYFIALVI